MLLLQYISQNCQTKTEQYLKTNTESQGKIESPENHAYGFLYLIYVRRRGVNLYMKGPHTPPWSAGSHLGSSLRPITESEMLSW